MNTNPVYIVGVGMTAFGKHTQRSVTDLAGEAMSAALDDAGVSPSQLQAAYYGNSTQSFLHGQLMIGGQIALRSLGVEQIPVFNVENACATGASAFHLAVTSIRAGETELALALGVERMNVPDREKMMAVFDGGYDISDRGALLQTLAALGGEQQGGDGHRSIFMDIYAAMARAHMKTYGSTQRQFAAVAAKNHAHATGNRHAFFQAPMSIEQVLGGRALSFPLTVPMCAPVTDGAAAVVVCSAAMLNRLKAARPVRVLAVATGIGQERDLFDYDRHITRVVGARAFEQAGVGPGDIDVVEVHDATAFGEVLNTEALGLFAFGEGGLAAEAGVTTIGGRLPVNPSGGLESKGHPLAATGLAQLYELVQQLRGQAGTRQVQGARLALAENGGGFLRGEEAVTVVSILEAVQ